MKHTEQEEKELNSQLKKWQAKHMLSIDEAIAHAREVANTQRGKSGICLQNGLECEHFSDCLKCAEEHEQLAEWLEELKAYREIGTVEECKNSVLDIQKAYNKAIDDAKSVILQTLDNEILVDTLHLRLEQLKERKCQ